MWRKACQYSWVLVKQNNGRHLSFVEQNDCYHSKVLYFIDITVRKAVIAGGSGLISVTLGKIIPASREQRASGIPLQMVWLSRSFLPWISRSFLLSKGGHNCFPRVCMAVIVAFLENVWQSALDCNREPWTRPGYTARNPPSTARVCPVTMLEQSAARKMAAPTISSGRPFLPAGVLSIKYF